MFSFLILCVFRCHVSIETLKPVYKKSKSALKRIRKWKPFKMPKKADDLNFLNLSLRIQKFGSLLCDSDQEFLSFKYENLELDLVFRPKNKLVLRTFINDVQIEDMTQFTLFPKVRIFRENKITRLVVDRDKPRNL